MTDVATWIAGRLPPDSDLGKDGSEQLAVALRAEEALWRPFKRHDHDELAGIA